MRSKPSRGAGFAPFVRIYRLPVVFQPFTLRARAKPKCARFAAAHASEFTDLVHDWAVLAVRPSFIVLIRFDFTVLAVPILWQTKRVGLVLVLPRRTLNALGCTRTTTRTTEI